MTNDEFVKLSADLRELARIVPLRWGAVQNNEYDGLVDMFRLDTFAELEVAIKSLDENVKQYFRRRWYMWKCAQCDEHIFCENDGVVPIALCLGSKEAGLWRFLRKHQFCQGVSV